MVKGPASVSTAFFPALVYHLWGPLPHCFGLGSCFLHDITATFPVSLSTRPVEPAGRI